MIERLSEYKYKCKVLKQIQSNKAHFYRKLNITHNIVTVFVSAFITFMGFSGMDRINSYVKMITGIDAGIYIIEMVFNIFVFFLFFVVISHFVFQFGSRQTEAEKAITLLSSLANEIDNILGSKNQKSIVDSIDNIADKYTLITQIIPSNTDREFFNAKKSLSAKTHKARIYSLTNNHFMSAKEHEEYILSLVQENMTIQKILTILAENNELLYMGGGIIRNLVWDKLHGYNDMTPIEDIDVIYYNKLSNTKEHDIELENSLKEAMPNFIWSVKNQARMHNVNNDKPYGSIQDAVSKWPETASAMLIRKRDDENYELIAPFGFDDLFRLIVQPTPHFKSKLDQYRKRIEDKKWEDKWEKIKVFYVD